MNRREFLKKSLEGIIIGIPLIYNCGKNPVEPDLDTNPIIKDGIGYYIQTDKSTYKLEENVEMLYRVSNLRSEEKTFLIVVSHPLFKPCNFKVNKDGTKIWVYYNNYGPVSIPTDYIPTDHSFTLQPNENKEFYDNWDMKDTRSGNLVNPGVYDVIGNFRFPPTDDRCVPVSVSININPK